jgi:hypothetical protein
MFKSYVGNNTWYVEGVHISNPTLEDT